MDPLTRKRVVWDRDGAEPDDFRLQAQGRAPRRQVEHGANRPAILLVEGVENVENPQYCAASSRQREHGAGLACGETWGADFAANRDFSARKRFSTKYHDTRAAP